MSQGFTPVSIFDYLSAQVIGQNDMLRTISVAIYSHINHLRGANILLIGNSGTGKTSTMKAIQRFYDHDPSLEKYRGLAIMNTNTLVDEEGEVQLSKIFRAVENNARIALGENVLPEALHAFIENATVCLDEVDKIPSRILGKANVMGIVIQQALLTILEGERMVYQTKLFTDADGKPYTFTVDTGKMLFICGGAFEEVYETIFSLIVNKKDDRKLREESYFDFSGKMHRVFKLDLKENVRLSDLFSCGYTPQFVARFGAIAVLEDLKQEHLKTIMRITPDSPLLFAQEYFQSMGVDFSLTEDALDMIAEVAAKGTRIGARALREPFNKVVDALKFDPEASGLLREEGGKRVLVIDRNVIMTRLGGAGANR
jgi:ATP-dependent Clp protease ATP-binding subunit ClpX